MPRSAEFDRDKARDRALLLFWRKGYQAASLTDLLAAMRIGRSSFYAAYCDKRRLFEHCLDLFAARTEAILATARAERAPLDALRYFFERHLEIAAHQGAHWGCLLVNTLLEMADVDEALCRRASAHLARMETLFADCLRDAGCPSPRADSLAAMLMTLNGGVRVNARRRLGASAQRTPIEAAFALLDQALACPSP